MGGEKVEVGAVGCRVLPICDAMSVTCDIGSCNDVADQKIEGRTSKKRRGVTRMRQLIKWAAETSKSSRVGSKAKLLKNQNRDANRESEGRSSNCSKINYLWEMGSCSSASSVYSNRTNQMLVMNLSNLSHCLSNPILNMQNSSEKTSNQDSEYLSRASRPSTNECVRMGQWITSDSDFVVLEL